MTIRFLSRRAAVLAGPLLLTCAASVWAQVPAVAQPGGLNLGSTSFYDGFSGPAGWSWLSWLRHSSANRIKDGNGNNVPVFQDPKISSVAWVNQIAYAMPTSFGGWRPGFTAILPAVALNSSFGPGPSLKDSGSGFGDLMIGAALQSEPLVGAAGQPVFVQRFELDYVLPTGKYDRNSDINPGAGYASLIPYWAGTLFPAPRWETSWRLHYLYNFRNDKPASSNPAPFKGQTVANTQAGQAAWVNFTASYAVTPALSVGLNGYYFEALTDSRANGIRLPDSRERVLGLGPGLMWRAAPDLSVWINTYNESQVRNRARNPLTAQVRIALNF